MKKIILAVCFALLWVAQMEGADKKMQTATFAGGCFWCVQPVFDFMKGVTYNKAGYAGGDGTTPSYENYMQLGYVEAVQVKYDPTVVTYAALLENFWKQIDPTDGDGQFADRGVGYRPVIFYHNEEQKKEALAYIEKMKKTGKYKSKIKVQVIAYTNFYEAELYHQQYYKKNPAHYELYKKGSGREGYIKKMWK